MAEGPLGCIAASQARHAAERGRRVCDGRYLVEWEHGELGGKLGLAVEFRELIVDENSGIETFKKKEQKRCQDKKRDLHTIEGIDDV
jgi:hypothetical protein